MNIEKEKLVVAFQKWNIEYIENGADFDDIDGSVDCAERQADKLIELLSE